MSTYPYSISHMLAVHNLTRNTLSSARMRDHRTAMLSHNLHTVDLVFAAICFNGSMTLTVWPDVAAVASHLRCFTRQEALD